MSEKKKICPRCKGNGFFKVKKSDNERVDIVVQCPQCKSEGEIVVGLDENLDIIDPATLRGKNGL